MKSIFSNTWQLLSRSQRADCTPWNMELSFDASSKSYSIKDFGGYETRTLATTHLVAEAMDRLRPRLYRDLSVKIFTDDFIPHPPNEIHFAYCKSKSQINTIAIPDFLFWGWPEVGLSDYEFIVEQMIQAGNQPFEDERLFWIGNPLTNSSRMRFLELAAANPQLIHGLSVKWLPPSPSSQKNHLMTTESNNYVSLPSHCRYRYLIDLKARGYSARLKLLLFSGRPLFVQLREWNEYFFEQLIPYEHYIPVHEDLSDLIDQISWAVANEHKVMRIADQARAFAMQHLRRCNAITKLEDCISQINAL
jgi:hypothetical protein